MKKRKKTSKALDIVESKEDKKMFQQVIGFLDKHVFSMSPLQVHNFVLNDIEYPTAFSKFEQAEFELASRYNQILDSYYQVREKQLRIEMKEKEIEKEKDELKKELLKLQKEKLELQLISQKTQVKKVVKEAKIFYKIYQSHPEFHHLTDKQVYKLQAEFWAKKTRNLPTVFEERYGRDYMVKALGQEDYRHFLEMRRKSFGLLPREIFEMKQLPDKDKKKL